MIIPEGRRLLAAGDHVLRLPSWLRAPLSLNRGAQYYSIYEDLHPSKQSVSHHASEIIISTIQPRHWPDLWRIEMVTYDRPGVLSAVVQLLKAHRLKVILAEGSIHSSNRLNTLSFVVSALNYSTLADKDRHDPFHSTLKTLDFMLKANLFEDLAPNATGWPKVKIKRFTNFKQLHAEAMGHRPTRIIDSSKQILELDENRRDGLIPLPSDVIGGLRRKLGDDLAYMWNVDTKFRFIRAYIFSAQTTPGHYQFSIQNGTTDSLSEIAQTVSDSGGNIIKFQLRRGAARDHNSGSRFDVTFTSGDGVQDWRRIDGELTAKLGGRENYSIVRKHVDGTTLPEDADATSKTTKKRQSRRLILNVHDKAMDAHLSALQRRYLQRERQTLTDFDETEDKLVKARLAQLPRLRQLYREVTRSRNTIFVSLAAREYAHHYKTIVEKCRKHGFTTILTGFDDDVKFFTHIRAAIFEKIELCDAFLGIWTKDYRFGRPGGPMAYTPGVWMPFELGAAMIQRKHAKILLERGSSAETLSPIAESNQGWFDGNEFETVVDSYLEALRALTDGAARG